MGIDIGEWLSEAGPGDIQPCGLFTEGPQGAPVPLRRRDVSANIYVDAMYADTKEELSYVSDIDCSAVFRFPLPPRSAVYRFRARVGDREVVTQVKPRSEAREEYELAVQQGHTAVHLSQHARGCSVFEVSVGNLAAFEEVVVEVGYLRLLESFGAATLEWVHTATWVPPYTGATGDRKEGEDKVLAALPTFASKVTYKLSYDISVIAEPGVVLSVECPEPGVSVVAPPAAQQSGGGDEGRAPAPAATPAAGAPGVGWWRVSQSEEVSDPSKDLTLTVELDPRAAGTSSLRLQRTPASPSPSRGGQVRTVALATFVPPAPRAPSAPGSSPQPLRREIWFVVDCSGSMGGTPIEQARQAALFFVRDLPVGRGVRFNVTAFGSRHVSLYDDGCRLYDAESERAAVNWIQERVHACMGGTEILTTFQHIYNKPLTPGYTREVIFLTDGGISGHEEQAVYDMVSAVQPTREGEGRMEEARTAGGAPTSPGREARRAAGEAARLTHVLCLGIGHGVHRGLLDGMASRSHCLAAYVTDDGSIAAKASFLKRAATAVGAARRPRLVARGALVRQAPHALPQRLFPGEPLHVLLEVLSCQPDATLELTAEYPEGEEDPEEDGEGKVEGKVEGSAAPGQPRALQLTLPLGAAVTGSGAAGPQAEVEEGEALAVLHAMSYIDSLMSGTSPLHVRPDGSLLPPPSPETVKDAVVQLAVAAHLVTPYTSAVGVCLRRDPLDPSAAARVAEVPLQYPHGRTLWADASTGGGPPGPINSIQLMSCAALVPTCDLGAGGAAGFKRCGRSLKKSSGLARLLPNFSNMASSVFGSWSKGGASSAAAPPPPAAPPQPAALAAPPPASAPPPPMPLAAGPCSALAVRHAMCADRCAAVPGAGPDSPQRSAAAAAELRGVDSLAAGTTSEGDPSGSGSGTPLHGAALLDFLNLQRCTEGYWPASPALAGALGLPVGALMAGAAVAGGHQCAHPVAAVRPGGLSDDVWCTVVVLAALRAVAGGQREVWGDMEGKALAWLGARWPAGARSVGGTVLAVAKLLAAV